MKKEYRNKLIATGALLFAILLFTIIDSFVRYVPEEGTTPDTQYVNDTELNTEE